MTASSKHNAQETAPTGQVSIYRRLLGSEFAVILAFLALAVLMTWPWVLHLRDAVPDTGDPYLISWIMWWDYYQTFHDPINLFQAPIFYPYSYTLAFSEHSYGIALPFFPLYALGARPLTVLGVATITGFAFSGYGAFRLARTLTGSIGVAWVAGIIFGFIPYRFHQLPHLNYVFAGWIPLLLEALVLFARERSWRRATWLGVAFGLNGLTCVHWFVMTIIPLGASGAYLLTRYRIWRDGNFWRRGGACLMIAMLALLPFYLPFQKVSQIYGMTRQATEAERFSAVVGNWLSADRLNKIWRGFGPFAPGERALFPGMLPLILALAAVYLSRQKRSPIHYSRPQAESWFIDRILSKEPGRTILFLDLLATGSLVTAALAYGYEPRGIRLMGLESLRITSPTGPMFVCVAALLVRYCLAYPGALRFKGDRNLLETLRGERRSDAFGIALIWMVFGFLGSLGMNFFFHRFLFENVFLFRSMRVPARWAMIAYVGLALLAALGARRLAELIARHRPRIRVEFTYTILCLVLLFEQHAAPIKLARGEPDPDGVTLFLKATPMRGGIVHLPAGGDIGNYRYVLRQADHLRPLVTAISGFATPNLNEIEKLSRDNPVPERFLDLLEEIPASYLVIHDSLLKPGEREAITNLLQRGIASGRLRYVDSFAGSGINGNEGAELYAVTRVEPNASSHAPTPARLATAPLDLVLKDDPTVLVRQFARWSFPIERFYRASFGRAPKYAELVKDAAVVAKDVAAYADHWQDRLDENSKKFAEEWVKRPEFTKTYAGRSEKDFVAQLFRNAGIAQPDAEEALVRKLADGSETRLSVLRRVVSNEDFVRREHDPAFVLMHYFGYLQRNPDDPPDQGWDGFNFWLVEFQKRHDPDWLTQAFMLTGEYRLILENKK